MDAVRILEHGNRYEKPKRFLCPSCWCKFEANSKEYRTETRKDGITLTEYFAATCPECGREAHDLDEK